MIALAFAPGPTRSGLQVATWILATITFTSFICGLTTYAAEASSHPALIVVPGVSSQRATLTVSVRRAYDQLSRFARQHGWGRLVGPGFIREVHIFDSKAAFDAAVVAASAASKGSLLPTSFVGGVFERKLLVVSPQVYATVHGEDKDPEAWEKLLTHEMAHQLHMDVLDGQEDKMGPVWFCEGFAAVAADQYTQDLPRLSKDARQHILAELRRGSYRRYEALLRYYMTTVPLAELVRHAGEEDFQAYLSTKFQDVPVPAPTPANIFHRSR